MRYLLFCLKIKAANINETASPEYPGNKMNKYSTPATAANVRINNIPFKGESILKAANTANVKNVRASAVKNIHKDALLMLI